MSPLGSVVAGMLLVVFGSSALSKVRSVAGQRAFAASLRPLGLVPDRSVAAVAAAVTAAEVAIAVGAGLWLCLPVGVLAVSSLALAGLLLAVLTVGIAAALHRGRMASCACFGADARPLSGRHLARNGLLLSSVLAGLAVELSPATPQGPVAALVAAAAGAVAGIVLVRLDDLIDLFAPSGAGGKFSARS